MKNKRITGVIITFLMAILMFTAFIPATQVNAVYPESSPKAHYDKYGDSIGYFQDGRLHWADRYTGGSSTSTYMWHIMGYRVKVTANGYTSYVDYKMGNGYLAGWETKSPGLDATQSQTSGSYRYSLDGLNYNELMTDIKAKNSSLGAAMAKGSYDVKIVVDAITEVMNVKTEQALDGPNYTAATTKEALQKYYMGTSIVDNYYGMSITIPKDEQPVVYYRSKAISFPNGGGYNSAGTTYYVAPNKLIYLTTGFESINVNMINQYFKIGDKEDGTVDSVDDFSAYYTHSSGAFTQNNTSGDVVWSANSTGPGASNRNTTSLVRNAFSLKTSGRTWYAYGEARNENRVYYGGTVADYVYSYTLRTDGVDPTFGGIPSSAWRNTDVSFTPTVADSLAGIKVATLKVNGSVVQTITPTERTTSSPFTARNASGVVTYTLDATDNVGNAVTKVFNVNIDKALPTIAVSKSPTAWTNGNVTLDATATDALSGVKSITLPNGTTVAGDSASQTVTTNGIYRFSTVDNAGNVKILDVSVTNIDKAAPTGTVSQTPTAWTNGDVTLNLTSVADTGGSGLKDITLPNGTTVTGTSASVVVQDNGVYNFVISDNAGNKTTKSITVDNIDRLSPTGTLTQTPTAWTNDNVTLNLTSIADAGGSGIKDIQLPSGALVTGTSASEQVTANGTYDFILTDKAGNVTTKSITVTNIDHIAPTATLTQTPTAWTNGDVTLNLTSVADSGGSGLKEIKLPDGSLVTGTSASFLAKNNGSYSFTVYDNAGNATTKSINVTNIDRTAPTGLLTRNPSEWTNGNVILTLSGVTDGSGAGIKHIVKPDNSLVTGATSATFTATANGVFTFKMVDNVGNESTRSITVNNIDKAIPSVTLNPNTVAWTNQDQAIAVSVTDTGGSGIEVWRSRVSSNNGSTYGAWSADETSDAGEIILATHGVNRIQVEVFDVAGNTRIVTSGTYSLDKVEPNGTITASPTTPTAGNVTLTVAGTDADSGVNTIKKPDGTIVTATSTTFVVTANGTYDFEITDRAGNSKTVSKAVTNIDKIAPTATLTQTPTDWTSGSVTLNLTAIADTGGSGYYRTKLPNGTFVTTTTASQIVAANGTYSFVVYDNAGNSTTLSIAVTNIDKTAPTATLTQTPTAWTNGNVTLNLTSVADVGSGVASIVLPNGNVTTGTSASYTVSSNNTYSMDILDNVGNKTTKTITVTNIDKVAPALSLVYDSVNGRINATSTDAASGVQSITLPSGAVVTGATATFTPPTVGKYTFIATDRAGNKTTKTISLDSPELSLSVDTEEWTNGNVIITAEGLRAMNPIDYIVMPDGTTKVYSDLATFTATANGTYTFSVYDTAGFNTTASITVSNIDKVKPAGTATLIPGTTALTIRYNGTDSLSGVKEIVLPNDNGVTGAIATYNVTKAGTYTAEVEDNAGNIGTIVATVQAPTVTITKEVPGWTNRDSFGLTASTTPRYVPKAKIQAPFASATWVTENSLTAQIPENGTYDFQVNDGGIVSTGTISVTNFDREEAIITIQEKAKSSTSATYNVKITDVGDVKP